MALYLRMFFTLIIGLYTSRLLLQALGISDFGLYNLLAGIVTMMAFMSNAMSIATQRFLSYENGKGDKKIENDIFQNSLLLYLLMSVLILLFAETIGLWFINNKLDISENRIIAANWVYQFTILSFIFNILNIPFLSLIIAHEKMNMFAILSVIESALRLIGVLILSHITGDNLIYYSLFILAISLFITFGYYLYTYYQNKSIVIKPAFNKAIFRRISSFAGWDLLSNVSYIGYNQGLNVFLNIFFGPVLNASRAIAFQLDSGVRGFVNNFMIATRPQIIKLYASKEFETLHIVVGQVSKYSFFLLFLIAAPVIIETEFVLTLWLASTPSYSIYFTKLVLISSLINTLSNPLLTLIHASGKMKFYQIMISLIYLISIPISYSILNKGQNAELGFALYILISTIILSYQLVYLKKTENFSIPIFLKESVFKVLLVITPSLVISFFIQNTLPYGYPRFALICIIQTLSFAIALYYLGLNLNEKKQFSFTIKEFFK